MRVIFSSEATYQATAGGGSYGTLAQLFGVGLVDSVVNGSTAGDPKSGYRFDAADPGIAGWEAFDATAEPSAHTTANPITGTGSRSFYVNEVGPMYFNATDTAPTCTATTARTIQAGSTLLN